MTSMTLKTKLITTALTLVALGGGYWWWSVSQGEEVVPTETVKRGTVSETISVTGELFPGQYADLSFKGVGRVEELWVKEGEKVQAGDPLVRLDRRVLSEELRSVEALLAIAEANEQLARRDWGGLSPEERRAKVLASEKARADVEAVRAEFGERVLRAPFDGEVTQVLTRLGETVVAGEVVLRLVNTAVAKEPFFLEAEIPESDVAKVAIGMQAAVTFDAFTNDEIFAAEVQAIEPSATVEQDVVSYTGTFALVHMADQRLRDGMTATIDIETGRRDDVLMLPFRALIRENGVYSVEVRDGQEFVKRTVKIGLEGDEGEVEIVSGLQAGDVVKLSTTSE